MERYELQYKFTGVFEKNVMYKYSISLKANEGYTFATDENNSYIGTATINGFSAPDKYFIFGIDNALRVQSVFSDPMMTVDGKDFSDDDLKADFDGGTWNWDAAKQKLTLHGYNGGIIQSCRSLTINVAEGTNNTVTASEEASKAAIASGDSMLIHGKGNLTVINENTSGCGIFTFVGRYCDFDMDGDLNIKTNGIKIYTDNYIEFSGSGNLNVDSKENALYLDSRFTISSSGNFTLTSCNNTIETCGDIHINGSGSVSISTTGEGKHAVYLINLSDRINLNGTGKPISLCCPDGAKAVYYNNHSSDDVTGIGGNNLAYYNVITISPNGSSIVCDHVNPFDDVPENSWYTNAALWCNAKGFISGTSATTFSPKTVATRAQAAVIFKNFVEVYVAKQEK